MNYPNLDMELINKSHQSNSFEEYSTSFNRLSPIAEYEDIVKSLQPYATTNPKSLSYFIKSVNITIDKFNSDIVFTWVARDDSLGFYKTFGCTNRSEVLERYYEACVYIDIQSSAEKNLYLLTCNRSNHSPVRLNKEDGSSLKVLMESIPDYMFDDCNANSDKEKRYDDCKHVNNICSSLNREYSDLDNRIQINSSVIGVTAGPNAESHFDDVSDSSTIYSDDTWEDNDNTILCKNDFVSRKEVLNYLYPKFVYSYSDCIDEEEIDIDYCKKPVIVDERGSWHYECPKVDSNQTELADYIRSWVLFKEENRNRLLNDSRLDQNDNDLTELSKDLSRYRGNGAKNMNLKADPCTSTSESDEAVAVLGKEQKTAPIRKRRRRNQTSEGELQNGDKELSSGYALRKKNLVGISPMEAFDNKWAYEKILRDIKKQSKVDNKQNNKQSGGTKAKKRMGRPPKANKYHLPKIEGNAISQIYKGYFNTITLSNPNLPRDIDHMLNGFNDIKSTEPKANDIKIPKRKVVEDKTNDIRSVRRRSVRTKAVETDLIDNDVIEAKIDKTL